VVSDDPQDIAEELDDEVVDAVDDLTGDQFGEGWPDYPPDRPQGVNTVGVTAVEEDAGESFAERTLREEPELTELQGDRDPTGRDVGQLVDESATSEDREEHLVGEAEPATELGPEELAMHSEEQPDDQ
jgi:hypothetical protein